MYMIGVAYIDANNESTFVAVERKDPGPAGSKQLLLSVLTVLVQFVEIAGMAKRQRLQPLLDRIQVEIELEERLKNTFVIKRLNGLKRQIENHIQSLPILTHNGLFHFVKFF